VGDRGKGDPCLAGPGGQDDDASTPGTVPGTERLLLVRAQPWRGCLSPEVARERGDDVIAVADAKLAKVRRELAVAMGGGTECSYASVPEGTRKVGRIELRGWVVEDNGSTVEA